MTSSPDDDPSDWVPLAFPTTEVATPPAARDAAIATETITSERTASPWDFPDMDAPPPPPPPELDPVHQAYEQGFTEGVQEGYARREVEVRSALEALLNSVSELQREREEQSRLISHYVHALSVAVAQKIVQREVTADPTIVKDLVGRSLELIPVNEPIEVHMCPADLAALRPQLDVLSAGDNMPAIQWVADSSLERASFIIESPQRVVSGKVDLALRTLYERLEYE